MKQEESTLKNENENEAIPPIEESSNASISNNEVETSFDSASLNEEQKGEESETKVKRHFKVLPYALVLIPSICFGVFGGILAKQLFGSFKETDYSGDYQTYYPDYEKVATRYEKAKQTGGNFISVLTPCQMAESALYLIQNEKHVFAQGIGEANASIVNQQIRSTVIQDGDLFFEESLSLSNFVNVADRMYQTPKDGDYDISMYPGVTVGGDVTKGTYDQSKVENFNGEGYIAHMGRLLSTPTSYIVSSKTVIEGKKTGNMYGETSSKKTDDGYLVDVELNPVAGVSAYVVQMETISDLATKPSFDYCHLTFELDNELNLKAITSYERYMAKIKIGVSSKITSAIRVVYERGGDYKIPELNEPCSYRSEM